MAKTDQEMLDKYKARIKRQNNAIKENYDRVSATLPLGTIDRIKALGLTINGVINDSVLAFLECAEETAEEPPTQEHVHAAQEPQISPKLSEGDNSCIEQETGENEANNEAERLAGIQALLDAKRAEEKAQEEKIQKMREERKEQQAEEFREMMRKRRSGETSGEDQEKEQIRQDTIARAMCEL